MTKKNLTLVIIFIILLFGLIFTYNKYSNLNKKMNIYENTILALNDSIHTIKDGKNTIYYQQAPEINIKDLINSEYFKTLSKEQQLYYNELSKIKGLISSSKAELEKQGNIIEILLNHSGTLKNDTISFKKGKVLSFKESDTTKKLQWKSDITLNDTIKFNLTYDYKFDIQTTYERQSDKSILVKYKTNDQDLKINKMYNFIIPVETKTPLNTWLDKNKKPLYFIGGGLLFVSGSYIGYKIAK